jgi:NAD-dependent dihydropyrimidine dehydrogenase PreA subunit
MDYLKNDPTVRKRSSSIRLAVLVTVLAASTFLGIMHQFSRGWVPPGVDAFCPFGGIESAFSLVSASTMLKRIAWSSFTLLFAVLAVAVLFRRSFCGNLCPLGTLQELFGRIGKLLLGKRVIVPAGIDRVARYGKYAMLLVFVTLSYMLGRLVIRPFDPWVAYHHLYSQDLFTEFSVGFGILAASLVGSMFFERVFCKYLCPMGGFLGLIHRVGIFRVKRNDATCIHCKACDRACPVNLRIERSEQVQSAECIHCNECVNACPVESTLLIGGKKRGRMGPTSVVLVSLSLFLIAVATASFTGGFEWKMKSMSEHIEEKGSFNPDDILGRHTFREVSDSTGIAKESFLNRFSISEQDFDNPIKEAAHREGSGFDTESVRVFVREQLER